MIEREKKRIRLNNKYAAKRDLLLHEYRTTDDFTLKLEIHSKIQKLPRNSAKIRIRNRCWKTGRPRGYYRDFGHMAEMAGLDGFPEQSCCTIALHDFVSRGL